MTYKNILTGVNTFSPDWFDSLQQITSNNIIIYDFFNSDVLNIIESKKIDYILPLSDKDYKKIQEYKTMIKDSIQILYPTQEIVELLHNKCLFTQFMLENFNEYIPDVYFLNGEKIKDIEYPVIFKPEYSTNGLHMKIYNNKNELNCININDKIIIQKYINYNDEYGAFLLCINGKIVNWKVIKHRYHNYHIKRANFPKNYINVPTFDIKIFEKIISKINYTGGMCIDFKYNKITNKVYIFEMNPRFGGSAFTNNFIYNLLCIK